jgi:hypothetical protein
MPTSVPTVSTGPDPVSLQRVHAQSQAFCAATDGNLPTQPVRCPGPGSCQPGRCLAPVVTCGTTGAEQVGCQATVVVSWRFTVVSGHQG